MQIDMSRFRAAFLEEAADHLDRLEGGLLQLEASPDDGELLNGIFRSAHSIKGASATFGFDSLARFTHGVEAVLDRLRDRLLAVSPELVGILLQATDLMRLLLAAAANGGEEPAQAAAVSERLSQYLESQAPDDQRSQARPAAPAGEAPGAATREIRLEPDSCGAAAGGEHATVDYEIFFAPGADTFRQGMDPLFLLRDLADLGEILETRAHLDRLPALDALDPESCYLAWTIRLRTTSPEEAIRDVFLFVEDSSDLRVSALSVPDGSAAEDSQPAAVAAPAPEHAGPERRDGADRRSGRDRRAQAAATATASIRVGTDKVDKLIDLVGELVISQSMLSQALAGFTQARLPEVLAAATEVERNTRELQERVMGIRMVPIANVFTRFPRLVHDLTASQGKQVDLEINGAETELDKAVVERLGDPLTHLVRNAVDHGLEPGDERARAGKPETGRLRLAAFHESGSVVVEIADDGRGLNTARIREKAIALGWMRADEELPDEQVHAFIFQPGFSTAEKVTDVSGRGVGMDVVKRNVESLNGTVSVTTRPGAGTTFRIRLPLTLAILDGLLLGVGRQVYIMPLVTIVESLRPKAGDVKRVLGKGEVLTVRGEALPLLRLHALFNVADGVTEPTQGLVVLLEADGRRFGVLVDEVLGQSQAVIKSLEANYRKVEGITAATILGDGHVALILDVPGLLRMAGRAGRQACEGEVALSA